MTMQLFSSPIEAAASWSTNGRLILSLAELGYLSPTDRVVDVTYGRGRWWTDWKPDVLIAHDKDTDGVDYRDLPEEDGSVDVVAFDPPYMPQGGRETSTVPEMLDRYGLDDVAKTGPELFVEICDGVTEAARVLRPGGRLLLKCMPFVNSGRLHHWPYDFCRYATGNGYRLHDELIHLSGTGPQPDRGRQLHARRNYSVMQVYERSKT